MTTARLTVNRRPAEVQVAGDETLLTTLREQLGLLGTKEGCLEGECGACTVLVDDKPIDACIYPTAACDGRRIRTVEGEGGQVDLSSLQRAFVRSGSIQCGFCTPGFVMTLTALLETNPRPSPDDVRNAVSGNICRCTGYSQIVEAVAEVIAVAAEDAAAGAAGNGAVR